MSEPDDYLKDYLFEERKKLSREDIIDSPFLLTKTKSSDSDNYREDIAESPKIFHPEIQSLLERTELIDEQIRKYRLDASPDELKAIKRFRYELEDFCRKAKWINDQIHQINKTEEDSPYEKEGAHRYIEKQVHDLTVHLIDLDEEAESLKNKMRENSLTANSHLSVAKPPQKKKLFSKDNMNYFLGWTLIGAAIVDEVVDPFKIFTGPALLYAGLALLGVDKVSEKHE